MKLFRLILFLAPIINPGEPGLEINPTILKEFKMDFLNNTGQLSNGFVSFTTSNKKIQEYRISIVNEYYPDGYLIKSGLIKTSPVSASFTYDNLHNGINNSIQITYGLATGVKSTRTKEIRVISSSNSAITGDNYKYQTGSGYLSYSNYNWTEFYDSYLFENFIGKSMPSYYHCLSLDDLQISKIGDSSGLQVRNIDLYLTNRNQLFSDMPISGNYMKIPLILVEVEGRYKLQISGNYYVNPTTLLMSSTYKNGYVRTNHIYFPHNEMRYQGEYQGRIVFSGLNGSNSNLSYMFTLDAQLNLLGNCIDSEYCVVTKDAVENELAYEI